MRTFDEAQATADPIAGASVGRQFGAVNLAGILPVLPAGTLVTPLQPAQSLPHWATPVWVP